MVIRKSSLGTNHILWWKVVLYRWAWWLEVIYEKNELVHRPRHQKKGGGIMVLPNGLTSFRILQRQFKSPAYIDLLSESVVPICKLNYGNNYCFQQDNSRIHTAMVVKEWMINAHFPVMHWPSRSADINIMENIWKMLEDIIWGTFKYKQEFVFVN